MDGVDASDLGGVWQGLTAGDENIGEAAYELYFVENAYSRDYDESW